MAHGLDLVETEQAAAPAASAGGGKNPDFWRAFEDGEVKVIGDEPANTEYDPGPSEKAVSSGEDRTSAQGVVARHPRWANCRVPYGETSRKARCRKSARRV